MLTNLLASLFGTNQPSDLARASLARWQAWLQPIDGESPVGRDPNYDDDFQNIRDEVAKLSGIDDAAIITATEKLLKHSAKDARLAAYYAYARMRRDGAEGVADGFELLAVLVDRYGSALLPARVESRRAAIEWLASSTFTHRLDLVKELSGDVFKRALSALALISERTAAWPASAQPDLGPLFRRLESRIEIASAPETAPRTEIPNSTSTPSDATNEPIAAPHELLDRARQIATFLREQAHGYLAAWRLMRCVRWDTLDELPPHDAAGRTKLRAPRVELRSNLLRLMRQAQWQELLERTEAAFAEGANHFWLDLQYYAFIAQERAGQPYAAARIAVTADCTLLLQRLPGLEKLAFEDGSPFADNTTLEWIARHATTYGIEMTQAMPATAAGESDGHWADLEGKALAHATQQGLHEAFAWLQKLPGHDTERQRFLRQLVMARVAERTEHVDIAIHLLSSLDTIAQRYQLAQWEPALAFEVKQHLLRTRKARMHRKDAVDKAAMARQIDTLLDELSAIDPARAVMLK